MSSNKYTLDRFEGEYAIFLKRPKEVEQLLIARTEIPANVIQGDVVRITDNGRAYTIEKLQAETASSRERVESLLAKLQAKQK